MRNQIKKLLREFSIDEISRTDYKDGELVVEYTDSFDYPRYMVYHETDDYSEIVEEFEKERAEKEKCKVYAGRKSLQSRQPSA